MVALDRLPSLSPLSARSRIAVDDAAARSASILQWSSSVHDQYETETPSEESESPPEEPETLLGEASSARGV